MLRSVYSRAPRVSRATAASSSPPMQQAIRSLSACHINTCIPIRNTTTAEYHPLNARRFSFSAFSSISSSKQHSKQKHQQQQQPHHHEQKRTKVFVSRHNNSMNVTASAILEYCNTHNIDTGDHRSSMTHVTLKECPFCTKPTGNKASNFYKFYLQVGGGAYFCHRCGAGGSWYDFKSNVGGYSVESMGTTTPTQSSTPQSTEPLQPTSSEPLPIPQPRLSGYYSSRLLDPQYDGNEVLQYLFETRGLNRKTLRQYGVGRASYKFPSDQGGYETAECVTFPWIMRKHEVQTQEDLRGATFDMPNNNKSEYNNNNNNNNNNKNKNDSDKRTKDKGSDNEDDKLLTRRIKVRAVHKKAWQRLDPPGGGWGLFGWHTVGQEAKEIVLTEGEYDAMAVHQATGRPAVSLPNGCRSLPVQILPLLEKFDKIYLWMDSDQPGQEGAEKFAKKLGMNRCYIVKTNEAKDANEALLQKLDLTALLDSASLVPHERILTFGDLRHDVLHELLQPDLYTGSPVSSLPTFTKLIKGFRRGELTVLTGPTGSGKTTFLGQVSLDMAEQGINVLWGSFEIKNTRLIHKLLKQFARKALPDHKQSNASELLGALADRFQNLPLYFMKFHGGSDVDEVLDAMEYAVYVNDVEHIILDNMQFMISRGSNSNSKWDKFDTQDVAIEKFRQFATEHNVHLTLVVHPRKEDEASKLNISSFYGSAKATQEADTVLILQHDGRRKYIDVKKNRFDGTLGYSPLYFQADSGRYVETEGGRGDSVPPPEPQKPIQFNPPTKSWKQKSEPEEEIPGLKGHWDDCLGLPP
jgi:twinkle protein